MGSDPRASDSPNAVLSPFEISLGFFRSFDAVGEVSAGSFQASLCECLQLKELTLLGIELTGSAGRISLIPGEPMCRNKKSWLRFAA